MKLLIKTFLILLSITGIILSIFFIIAFYPRPNSAAISNSNTNNICAYQPSIKVLTYNTWGVPIVSKDDTRIKDIANSLSDYDIVGLQEVFTNKARKTLEQTKFPYKIIGGVGSILFRAGNGLVFLSKFPIIFTNSIIYQSCFGSDCLAEKGAVLARIMLPSMIYLDIYITHLQSGGSISDFIRNEQMKSLSSFIQDNSENNPVLLIGDLNTDASYPEHRVMLHLLKLKDLWNSILGSGETYSPNNSWNSWDTQRQRIDYILFRSGKNITINTKGIKTVFNQPIKGRFLSDHFGVEAKINITTK